MAEEIGFYEVNPAPPKHEINPDASLLFKGSGDATLTIFGFESWKEFLRRGDRPLAEAEIDRLESAATCENYSIGGRVTVEWPEVRLDFAVDYFLGKCHCTATCWITAQH